MTKKEQKNDIALEAILILFDTLLYKLKIPATEATGFILNDARLRNIYDEPGALVCMLHDDSIQEFAYNIGEMINGNNGIPRNNI